jgi:hypothetical protein
MQLSNGYGERVTLAIVRRPTKRGKMRYQVRVEGHKTETFDTKREADYYAATLRLKRKPTRTMTCGELVDRYNALWKAGNLPHQSAPPKQSTMSTRRQNLALFLAEFADSDVNELDALRVEVWATAHTWAVASVNPIWNYAAKRDIVSHNPFANTCRSPAKDAATSPPCRTTSSSAWPKQPSRSGPTAAPSSHGRHTPA